MKGRRRVAGSDAGSILPLVAIFAALAIALVLVVTAATSLYLERKRLFTVADGAALAGAESFVAPGGATEGPVVRLDPGEVRAAAAAYLASSPRSGIEDLRLEDAGSPDGRSAAVTLSGTWRPPVLALFVPDGVRLEVTARARGVFV